MANPSIIDDGPAQLMPRRADTPPRAARR